MTLPVLLLLLFLTNNARAATLGKQSVGLRSTNNVYFENENPVSDSYLLLNSRWTFEPESSSSLRAHFDYADYLRESTNDYLYLHLKLKPEPSRLFRFFHRNYLHGNSAISDTSFTHSGFAIDFEKETSPRSNWLVFATAGYQLRYFHDFGERTDHQFSALASLDFLSYPQLTPYIYSGLGFVLSTYSAYSLRYLDLGTGIKGPFAKSWKWSLDLDIRATTYTQRRVDDVIEVQRGRGSGFLVSVSERERAQTNTLGGALNWQMSENLSLETGLNISSQSSNNPNLEYKNNEVYLTLSYQD